MQEILWTEQGGLPILALLQLLPLLTALLVLPLKAARTRIGLALFGSGAELLLAIHLLAGFDREQSALQFAEHLTLFGPLAYHAAVDGVGVLFVLLTALLSLLMVVYSPIRTENAPRLLALILAAEAILMGLFTSIDLGWFLLLSVGEFMVVGALIAGWSHSPEKDVALARYYQFLGTAMLLTIIGVSMLGWHHHDTSGGAWSFDLFDLAGGHLDPDIQTVIFFLLFYGLAIRIPVFPLHGWLPSVAEHGTTALAPTFLLGLKVGVYGLIRFVLPILPDAVQRWQEFVVTFAVFGTFYAALLAMLQVNLRRLLAFAVVSHTSILFIGLFSLNHLAFTGSVLLSATFGLAITGLLITTGLVYQRTHTALLDRLGGLFDRIPLIGLAFFIAGLSIVGMPGTPGFDAAHLIMEAAMRRFGALVTIAAALGNVIAAGFLLWAFQRAFLAPASGDSATSRVARTSPGEALLALILILVLLGSGFYSEPWIELVEHSFVNLDALYADSGH
ncbi:MAG: NADH-quinone oxidoreductase subunit L [Candidatus Sedimenticola endophacoides]|uniref:NADH-quinone oxidoreductase subunit M n=1 Tax=Candidatus Sedimenticola endophacoides TaxID=2548426 RepID=A0A657Q5B3_9GAMM|nr:MAG: NADH-quinone oxidoreductase subunit L [Candidatus Sedimenticola endophacoides]OQX33239.1 MAG: NADH-quinone oxidoreductase subunit L [Candidatus Sedimenticola endophacoides]OQX33259.1 MAG: NADH-quinone oxidoreductase subunit L [Candidatus Sedimenticola endophacoides]OQX39749.1 MAG: NADH-quinone oxidoreductase subunit L [Candidatus Sedimenticola endophacoides]OQX42835.1 MAG: NADH-quinone oxidoreductase subunit L [Candidatus Sedimenticola endophacoides]